MCSKDIKIVRNLDQLSGSTGSRGSRNHPEINVSVSGSSE